MNGNNNRNNNDEKLHSSLSSSVKERAMENEGNKLQAAREKQATMPSNLSSNGNVERGNGLPSKNSIGASGNGLGVNKGIPNKIALPGKDALNKGAMGNNAQNPSNKNSTNKNSPSGGGINAGAQALKSKVASKGLQALGVPKKVSEGLVNSKLGKKAMGMATNPVGSALNSLKSAGKSEAEKDAVEKEEEEQQKEKRSGFITLRLPLKLKLILFIAVLPSFTFVVLFLAIFAAYVADEGAYNIFLGAFASKEEREAMQEISKMHNEIVGNGSEVGMGDSLSTYNEFLSRTQNLGNIFEFFECESDEECLERDEVKFYIKVNDIAIRYRRKYNITLDWELLMATALSMNLDVKEMFVYFLNEYDYDDVEKYNILMDLDWDYDYKKIPGYAYLTPDDYRYDLQILAKNMVTKTTTQTCSKTVTNEDGSTSVVITKTQTDTDIEEQYFKSGQPYYLQCAAGETYDISSIYKLDLEKYDDFLLEYIEHKLYLGDGEAYDGDDPNANYKDDDSGEISTDYDEGNSLADSMVNLALSQKGVSGTPNKYTNWLGPISGYGSGGYAYPWCATFVSWVIANTNYNGTTLSSIINYKSASTGAWARYFRDSSNLQFKLSKHYGGTYQPKKGDIILFTWQNSPNPFNPNDFSTGFSHIGIVTGSDDNYVYTIEGNTSNMVAERKYKIDSSDIDGYGVWY